MGRSRAPTTRDARPVRAVVEHTATHDVLACGHVVGPHPRHPHAERVSRRCDRCPLVLPGLEASPCT